MGENPGRSRALALVCRGHDTVESLKTKSWICLGCKVQDQVSQAHNFFENSRLKRDTWGLAGPFQVCQSGFSHATLNG